MAVFKTPEHDLTKGLVRFDGKEYAFDDATQRTAFSAAFNAHIAAAAPKRDALDPAALAPMIDELMAKLSGAHDVIMAMAAMLAEDMGAGAAPESLAAAEDMMGMETLDSIVAERQAVLAKAKAIAPAVEVKGKKTHEIQRAVLDAAQIAIPAGVGAEYIRARFDSLPVQSFSADDRLTVDSGAPGGDAAAVVEAHKKLRKGRSMQWRKGKAAK